VIEQQGRVEDAAALFQQAEQGFRAAGNGEMAKAAAERAARLAPPPKSDP